jgi:hypothetical protein
MERRKFIVGVAAGGIGLLEYRYLWVGPGKDELRVRAIDDQGRVERWDPRAGFSPTVPPAIRR